MVTAHWDHVMGFPFFKPLYYQHAELLMHRCPFHSKFVETILSKVMAPPNFPVRYLDIKAKIVYEEACPATFEIGSIQKVDQDGTITLVLLGRVKVAGLTGQELESYLSSKLTNISPTNIKEPTGHAIIILQRVAAVPHTV